MLPMTQARGACPQCGSADFTVGRMDLLSCVVCGIVLSPVVWQSDAAAELERDWFGGGYCAGRSRWEGAFEALNNRRTLKRLRRLALRGRRLLEVGVGSGSLLAAARAAGFDVVGCDLSPDICESVKRAYGVPVVPGAIEDVEGQGRFDVIVANHVLEHVSDPLVFLNAVRRLLAGGGICHLAVPNIGCPEAALSGWGSYEPYHLLYFTPATVSALVANAGLRVFSVSTHESFSGYFVAVSRTLLGVRLDRRGTWQAARGASRRFSALQHIYRGAMVVVGSALCPVRLVQGLAGLGDEIVCIAQEPATEDRSNVR